MKTWAQIGIEVPDGITGEYAAKCPWCSSDRRKKAARCLSVNTDKLVYHCNHCGIAGTLKDGHGNSGSFAHWQKPIHRTPVLELKCDLPERVTSWFAGRGIPIEVLIRNRIAYQSVYMPQLEDHTTAIVFPYFRAGELVNAKYRDGLKNFRLEAGAELILYGLDDIDPTRCVLVEGEVDKLSIETCGVHSCVSVPNGAPPPTTKDYASKLNFLENLPEVERWILAVDADEPGQRLEYELARRIGRDRCWCVKWPEGCKDANEVLVLHGRAKLRECIETAKPYPIEGRFAITDQGSNILQLYEHGWERGLSTGWRTLDKHYTVRPGEFTVVTGVPSSGKSNFVDALCVQLATLHGWSFGIFSPENLPLEDHMARIIEKYVGLPFGLGMRERMDRQTLDLGMRWANEHFWWMLPPTQTKWTLGAILEMSAALVRQNGITGLVLDPWNELDSDRSAGQTETEYIGECLRAIRRFAREHGVHVWLVAHPTKLFRMKDNRYPIPTLYDIHGSAHFRNRCDNGLVIARDQEGEDKKEVEVHIQKIKFRQVGRQGTVTLHYVPSTATYLEALENGRPDLPREWGNE